MRVDSYTPCTAIYPLPASPAPRWAGVGLTDLMPGRRLWGFAPLLAVRLLNIANLARSNFVSIARRRISWILTQSVLRGYK